MRPTVPTIALVENDLASSTAFQRLLRAHGYAVEAFRSAEAYLVRASSAQVDCLLLDVELDGMSGLELQRRLGRQPQAVPVVFMTGRHDRNIEQCAREQGCSGFLYKPFDGVAVATAIEAALTGRQPT